MVLKIYLENQEVLWWAGGMSRYKAICNYVANQNYLGFKFSNSNKEETFVPSEISIDILIKDLMTK